MIDVVKLSIAGRNSDDSKASFDRFILEACGGRIVPVEVPWARNVYNLYKDDDWDVLLVEDEEDLHSLFYMDSGAFSSFPIIQSHFIYGVNYGTGILSSAAHAAIEASRILLVTEDWALSQYQKDSFIAHCGRFFKEDIVRELKSKIAIVPLGIEIDEIREPNTVGNSGCLRIFFPHRMVSSKGIDRFLTYLRRLHKADYALTIIPVMGKGRTKAYREIEQEFDVENYPRTPRESYLSIAASCDIIFSHPRLETFGLAVMEAVSQGCYPILVADLSYPELYPKEVLFSTTDEAVRKTLGAIGSSFDNSMVNQYTWNSVAPLYIDRFEHVVRNFYSNVSVTDTGNRIIDELRERPKIKKEILKFLGWGKLTGWGKYRQMIKTELPISVGPNAVYGSATKVPRIQKPKNYRLF